MTWESFLSFKLSLSLLLRATLQTNDTLLVISEQVLNGFLSWPYNVRFSVTILL